MPSHHGMSLLWWETTGFGYLKVNLEDIQALGWEDFYEVLEEVKAVEVDRTLDMDSRQVVFLLRRRNDFD